MHPFETEVLRARQALQQGVEFLNDEIVPKIRAETAGVLQAAAVSLDRAAESLRTGSRMDQRRGSRATR